MSHEGSAAIKALENNACIKREREGEIYIHTCTHTHTHIHTHTHSDSLSLSISLSLSQAYVVGYSEGIGRIGHPVVINDGSKKCRLPL